MPSLAGKKWLAFLKRRKASNLDFSERVVFSYLVYQARHGCGASIGSVARFTGLSRDVVPDVLKRLRGFGLVKTEGGEHFALEPSGETAGWFPIRKGGRGRPWVSRLAYYPVYMVTTACPLTDRQNVLYWCLRDLDLDNDGVVKGQTESGLAALLSVSRQTVGTALGVLRGHGLIEIGRGQRTLAFRLAGFPLAWLRDVKEAAPLPDEEDYVWETDGDVADDQDAVPATVSSDDDCTLTLHDRVDEWDLLDRSEPLTEGTSFRPSWGSGYEQVLAGQGR